jgi:hypothetical protein
MDAHPPESVPAKNLVLTPPIQLNTKKQKIRVKKTTEKNNRLISV